MHVNQVANRSKMHRMSSSPESYRVPGPSYLVAGRYRLKSRIGGGGMGTVWLARDQLLDREVAVKQVVSTEGLNDDTADNIRQRAMREGRIAAKLSHRNAIAMHDVALDRGEPWLVMEYLPSRSVAQILHTTQTLPVPQAAQIGAQVADAMAEAHAAGIIHRDIKPGNILIATGRNAGLVKITDFGISRAKDDVTLTQTGVITGTPAYFAPEVARGADPTEASDVYSLGATVYTIVEGEPPFGVDENSLVLLHKVARAQINPMKNAGELRSVLLHLLEPHPAKRPTMEQARDELAAIAAGTHGSTRQVLSTPVSKPGGGVPIWAQGPGSSRGAAQSPTSGSYTPVSSRATLPPRQPTRQMPTGMEYDTPTGVSAGIRSGPYNVTKRPTDPAVRQSYSQPNLPPSRSSSSSSSTALALSVFAFFVVLAAVVVLLIALMR